MSLNVGSLLVMILKKCQYSVEILMIKSLLKTTENLDLKQFLEVRFQILPIFEVSVNMFHKTFTHTHTCILNK